MKTKTAKLEFTPGNSKSPLPAGPYADGRPNRDEERKNKDLVERERKRVADEEDGKKGRRREENK